MSYLPSTEYHFMSFCCILCFYEYVMESGRFSQSTAFFKRAGHNVEGFLLYVPLQRFYSFAVRKKNAGDCQQSYLSPYMDKTLNPLTTKNKKIADFRENSILVPLCTLSSELFEFLRYLYPFQRYAKFSFPSFF